MKTVNIKGKPYIMVNERVKKFRETYPLWSIETKLTLRDGGIAIIKATIKNEEGRIISQGYAYENETSSFINKTSYIENCETSAIGRALGFLGIGIDASIATADEIANAIKNQR